MVTVVRTGESRTPRHTAYTQPMCQIDKPSHHWQIAIAVMVVLFWCGDCRADYAHLSQLHRPYKPILTSNVATGCDRHRMPRPSVTLTFDRLTVKLACNLHSKFGHARPLGSQIIRYVRDKRTDRQPDRRTDKSNAYCPLPYGREHNKLTNLLNAASVATTGTLRLM